MKTMAGSRRTSCVDPSTPMKEDMKAIPGNCCMHYAMIRRRHRGHHHIIIMRMIFDDRRAVAK